MTQTTTRTTGALIGGTLAGARASDTCGLWRGAGTQWLTRAGTRTIATSGATPAATGRCGAAVRVERGATNLFTNPSFEVNATGATPASGVGAETLTRVTSDAAFGTACLKVDTTTGAANAGAHLYAGTLTSGQAYTFSLYCKVASGSVRLAIKNAAFTIVSSQTVTPAAGWQRIAVTITAAATETHRMYFETTSAQALTFYLDGVQAEAGAAATTYLDGSLGTGYAWTGTAHASTSTRASSALTVAASQLRADRGALALWLRPAWASSSTTARTALEWRAAADRLLRLRFSGSAQWALDWVSGATTDTATVAASHAAEGDVLLLAHRHRAADGRRDACGRTRRGGDLVGGRGDRAAAGARDAVHPRAAAAAGGADAPAALGRVRSRAIG